MATTTQRTSHTVRTDWTDVITSIPGAANAAGMLRNKSGQAVEVIKGGNVPVATDSGVVMEAFGKEYCEASHIWVRTIGTQYAVVAFEALS